MIASTIYKEQNMRPGVLLGQSVEEDLKAFSICCRQDQEHTSSVIGTHGSIQVREFSNELAGNLRSYPLGSPTRSRAVHPTEPGFISKHNSQRATLGSSKTTSLGHRGSKPFFFKVRTSPTRGRRRKRRKGGGRVVPPCPYSSHGSHVQRRALAGMGPPVPPVR